MQTKHKIIYKDSRDLLNYVKPNSIDLIVTSPPYPMIAMWDNLFRSLNEKISNVLINENPVLAYKLMHLELNKIWKPCIKVLKSGGFLCINIGDAARTLEKRFRLFTNHSRILELITKANMDALPFILWNKVSNRPNKYMGSGMLPAGAYVTLENEFILIFRKGEKREYTEEQKNMRRESSYFWNERNTWFSDVWKIGSTRQTNTNKNLRNKDASFPFELPYRLINMFSLKNDLVLDPFLGTGTTITAAIASQRNSIGFEIDENYKKTIEDRILNSKQELQTNIQRRIKNVQEKNRQTPDLKYFNSFHNLRVKTKTEELIKIFSLSKVTLLDEIVASYE